MSLFGSLFSGSSGRKAAMATAQQLAQTQANVNNMLTQGQANQIAAIDRAEPLSLNALGQGYDTARGALATGYQTARDDYGRASEMYNPYAQTGLAGFNLYADANGLNGAGGNANATAAFHASPGYQWNVDQATDALARKASSLGTLGGGNTMAAISDRAGNMANQEYTNWLGRLQGIGQTGYNAMGAQAGIARGQGDLASGYGQDLARYGSGYGSDVASLYGNNAARRAGAYGTTTALGVNALTDLGKTQAQNTSAGMMAGQNVGPNTMSTILGLAGLGAKIGSAPMTGGTSLFGKAFS